MSISLLSLGLITELGEKTFSTAQFLMKYLAHPNAVYRANAVSSIVNLISVMDTVETSTALWILLPLYGDLNYNVRMLISKFRRNVPSFIQQRCNSVLPHPDDSSVLPIT
jgi:hypothetical protein